MSREPPGDPAAVGDDAPSPESEAGSEAGTSHPTRPAQRFFAWLMARIARRYDRQLGAHKRALLGDLQGTVLEIGPGTGTSLPYLSRTAVEWIGLEPNLAMWPALRRTAQDHGLTVDLRRGFAHRTGLPTDSVDVVISSLVLCSVRALPPTLAELHRVLRPGGQLVFLEHVGAPPGTWLRRAQGWARPAWRWAFDNCHPDRDTAAAIAEAGFVDLQLRHFDGPLPVPLIRPHVMGSARKPGG